MSATGLPRLLRFGVSALAIAGVIALIAWCLAPRPARLPCRLAWEQAMSGPNLLFSWLAERCQDSDGTPDWHRLPESGRHLWATLHFELAGFQTPRAGSSDPPPPAAEDVVTGYAALGLPEAADAVRELARLAEQGQAVDSPAWRRARQRVDLLRPRCAQARQAYLLAHRAELDRTGD